MKSTLPAPGKRIADWSGDKPYKVTPAIHGQKEYPSAICCCQSAADDLIATARRVLGDGSLVGYRVTRVKVA